LNKFRIAGSFSPLISSSGLDRVISRADALLEENYERFQEQNEIPLGLSVDPVP
jgi:hypothetical protein